MATFSENQVRHLYVAKSAAGKELGAVVPKTDKEKGSLWFEYVGPSGVSRTDLIPLANIVSAKASKSESMKRPLNRFKVTLDSEVHQAAGAAVVAGQDYILRLAFSQYVGMSDEDQYWKYGMVHGVAGMTADTFYKTMAISIAKNVAREVNKLVKVYVHTSKGAAAGKFNEEKLTEVTANHTLSGGAPGRGNNWDDGAGTRTDIDYILLEEVEQPWVLGKMAVGKIPMEVQPTTITVGGDEVIWGKKKKEAPKTYIENGKVIADLEYFCMGERGDLYRGMGYPNNIHTEYLVDPTRKYDVIDITYFYAGDNEDIQKSQKVLTIVMDDAGHTIESAMAKAINAVKAGLVEDFNA